MTSKEMQAELARDLFVPLRLHLVSGKTLSVDRARRGLAHAERRARLSEQGPK
jgi:hypothetical protein